MTLTRTFRLIFILFFFSLSSQTILSAQLYMKLQWMPTDSIWGVFIKTDTSVQPSNNIAIATGQITVVAPTGFVIEDFNSYAGNWVQNARVNSPIENKAMDYISFGVNNVGTITGLKDHNEVLILSFKSAQGVCPTSLYLIEKDDPFDNGEGTNSATSNPGNDLKVLDIDNGRAIYIYEGTYDLDAWNCGNPDMTTSVNEIEEQAQFYIFPNPFKDQFTFKISNNSNYKDYQIKLYDGIGRTIYTSDITNSSLLVQAPKEGTFYFYKVYDIANNEIVGVGKLIRN